MHNNQDVQFLTTKSSAAAANT